MPPLHEIRDQTAHAVAAFVIVALSASHPLAGGALAGLLIGLVREVTEEGKPVTLGKLGRAASTSKLDLAFWALGGAIAGVVARWP